MNISSCRFALVAVAAVIAGSGCVSPVRNPEMDTARAALDRLSLADATVETWSETSALAARRMIERYGIPDAVHPSGLVWNGSRPWKRIVVRDIRPLYVESEDMGVVEQTVEYPLTPAQAGELAAFDARLTYDPHAAELSSRADREELNFLRLNLANEIVNRRMTDAQARDEYARLLSLEASGKSSPLLQGLSFAPGL